MDFLANFFSYDQLRFVWWLLIGVLLIGYAITDGFDIGVAILLKIVGKNDDQRRVMINSVAPHWDGNQVWLLTGGGAIFAAWPIVYAASFSGFYLALMLVLMALFFRPLGFEYRSKIKSETWRSTWDWCLTFGSLIPALVIGVAFGNLLQGVPFDFVPPPQYTNLAVAGNVAMPFYHGGLFGDDSGGFFRGFLGLIALLNPYALLAGLLSLFMLTGHGAAFLQLKTEGKIRKRSEIVATILGVTCAVLFILAGIWLYFGIEGYAVTSTMAANGPSVPAGGKEVVKGLGLWFSNYKAAPLLLIFPAVGIIGFLVLSYASKYRHPVVAFVSSALAMVGVIFTAAVSMFPFIMPSSTIPSHSLTMWDATASNGTLAIMTLVALTLVPIVLTYTIWAYYVMRGRLTEKYIEENSNRLY